MTFNELQALLIQAQAEDKKGNYDDVLRLVNKVMTKLDSLSLNEGKDRLHTEGEYEALLCIRALAYYTIGEVSRKRGDLTLALEHYSAALATSETARDVYGIGKAMTGFGNVFLNLSSYDKSLEYYTKALTVFEEIDEKSLTALVIGNMGIVYRNLSSYDKAFEYYTKSLAIYEELGEKSSAARITGNIGGLYYFLGSYDKALEYFAKVLVTHEEVSDRSAIASVTMSIGGIHKSLGSYERALEFYTKALAIHEELGEKSGIASATSNIGNLYAEFGYYDKSLEYFTKVLVTYEELDDKSAISHITGNIGVAYFELKEYAKAISYQRRALAIAEEIGDRQQTGFIWGCIGTTLSAMGEKLEAMEYLEKALHLLRNVIQTNVGTTDILIAIGVLLAEQNKTNEAFEKLSEGLSLAEELGNKEQMFKAHKELATIQEKKGNQTEAFNHFKKFYELEKEVLNEETKKTVQRHDIERQAAEREKEIALAKATADAKHQATEELLHNVLPPSIANKMLDGTKLIAEKLPSVSVLFADIVGFTKLSQRISPEELVEGLDRIFSVFDSLAEKHGLEKIKTIGDAYMVVSGAPEPRADHAEAMAQFALEMVEAMKEFTSKSTGEAIQLRIGIHSGEVVAGVIGKKKFAYDMWGDAVNTASRMESHGEPGKIHVSEDFARNLTPTLSPREGFSEFESSLSSSFPFGEGRDGVLVERGEMHIKGKGLMKTYYLQKANP